MYQNDYDKRSSIRQKILAQRAQFSALQREQASQKINGHLVQWPIFQKAEVVHIFLNQSEEPQTVSVIESCWKIKKTVVVPYMVGNNFVLGHSPLTSFNQLQAGKFNIKEPISAMRQSIELEQIDLVIVPGVAFDEKGGRLGYGKGYYDRFLSQIHAFFLGLAFDFQVVDSIPQLPHDIPMDAILTEKGFI
ncbi:MAG: 5-formyltetrahydrofolate cyclo-ligase [SAR324 cluster bacterium]|nr:5-formyltetrahydrofolate cyclo-ligase [SAR324 cluster bacterium]